MTTIGRMRSAGRVAINIWAPEWDADAIGEFDAEKLVATLVQSGVDTVFTWQGFTHDHFGASYYPTKYGERHRNLAPGRDHAGEFVTAAHEAGIRVLGYYSYTDAKVAKAYPDWRQQDEAGTPSYWGLCPNSPYREYFIAKLVEMVTLYPLDGMSLDGVGFDPGADHCYCVNCQQKYRARFGLDLPIGAVKGTVAWRQFQQWRFDCISEFLAEIRIAVKEVRPEIDLGHLVFPLRDWNDWQIGDDFERTFAEFDDYVSTIPTWIDKLGDKKYREIGAIWGAGIPAKVLRSASDKPTYLHVGRFAYDREYTTLPVRELLLGAYSILVNGAAPVIADNLFPSGAINEVFYERLADVYAHIRARERYRPRGREISHAALLYSKRSNDESDTIYPEGQRYLRSFQGAFKILNEGHVPFDVITDRQLTADVLARYRVVVLPDAAMLSGEAADAVADYVVRGGSVVATGGIGLIDEHGGRRSNFALADILGVDYVSPVTYSRSFIDLGASELADGIETREKLPLRGAGHRVTPRPEATELGRLVLPATEVVLQQRVVTYSDDVHPGRVTSYSSVVTNEPGKGRAVYFAGDVTGTYGIFGYPQLRKLLLNGILWAARGPAPFTVDAPLSVEAHCFEDETQLTVHLLNYTTTGLRGVLGEGGVMAEEGVPCRDIRFTLQVDADRVTRVALASTGEELSYAATGDAITVSVAEVDIYEAIVVERAV
jgi:hypothetical protein